MNQIQAFLEEARTQALYAVYFAEYEFDQLCHEHAKAICAGTEPPQLQLASDIQCKALCDLAHLDSLCKQTQTHIEFFTVPE